jgi:hypothetical protein
MWGNIGVERKVETVKVINFFDKDKKEREGRKETGNFKRCAMAEALAEFVDGLCTGNIKTEETNMSGKISHTSVCEFANTCEFRKRVPMPSADIKE